MNIEKVLYFIGVVSNFSVFAKILFGTLIIMTILSIVSYAVTFSDDSKEHIIIKRITKYFIITLIVFGFIGSFIPTEKTMYMMLASNVAKKSEIPEKVLKAIEMKLDEYIDDVKNKSKS